MVAVVFEHRFDVARRLFGKKDQVRKGEPAARWKPVVRKPQPLWSRNERKNAAFGEDEIKRFLMKIVMQNIADLKGDEMAHPPFEREFAADFDVFGVRVDCRDFTTELFGKRTRRLAIPASHVEHPRSRVNAGHSCGGTGELLAGR